MIAVFGLVGGFGILGLGFGTHIVPFALFATLTGGAFLTGIN